MDCEYKIVGITSQGEHSLRCVVCGHNTSSTYMPELVHRRCDASVPGAPQDVVLTSVRYDLGTAIDDDDWPEVSRRATACCGCPKFSGYGCAELGKRCRTGRIRWLERLVMGECDGWAT